ncbi:blue (type 1) copper domain protein [Leptothrix cholodnii SP-6]|uniref:Blue (Type 1) copper domain protein n=1 Tax=Leptothrix cholodnii (strain ATCC 51168 / LMG 8142 / SP-6) TaxID=395495 RepID=B1Y5E8_LEPCP|nr:cupredoxin family protein [Leptothrix cholodnii]ACB33536.1 blue (type 1) copper domain protein [Leptothrix cholodnii SP-6]
MTRKRRSIAAAWLVGLLAAGTVQAHGEKTHAQKAEPVRMEQKDWGIAGDPKAVVRTVEIRMSDKMRFTPDRIEVREGETIRLVHRNGGKILHEFVLGTKQELEAHAALMLKFPDMEHDEPYMVHVGAGKRGEIVWHFNRAGEFDFACLIPGHYQAGMVGKIVVTERKGITQ